MFPQVDSVLKKLYNIPDMVTKDREPMSTGEKFKNLAWKILIYSAVAFGALTVINHLAAG